MGDISIKKKKVKKRRRRFGGQNVAGGNHTLLTDELIEEICVQVRAGNYVETACAYVGIHKDTFYDWLKKAANQPGNYPMCVKFSDAVRQAESDAESRYVKQMEKATKTDWKATAWMMERRFSKRWMRVERQEHTGADGEPIKTEDVGDISKLTDEEKKELAKLFAKAGFSDPEADAQ